MKNKIHERIWKLQDELRSSGFKMQESLTPFNLGNAIVTVLKPEIDDFVYDGAMGIGGFLISTNEYIKENAGQNSNNIFGREINQNTYEMACNIAKEVGLETKNLLLSDSLRINGEEANKYDVILSSPPFGLRANEREGELGIKTNDGTNLFLQHYINSLKIGGRAAIIVMHSFFFSSNPVHTKLRKYLLEKCNLHTILELPSNTFSGTSIGASVLFFTKGEKTKSIKYYLKRLADDYSEFVDFANENIYNERSFIYSASNIQGDRFDIPLASTFVIDKEIEEKTKNFKDFKKYKLSKVCLEVNLTKENFKEKPNAVYLPKIGKSPAVTSVDATTLKHQNYFQLIFDSKFILNGYLAYYLRSSLGQMILESCFTGSIIRNITKRSLEENLVIYAPSLKEQELISSTLKSLDEVMSLMERTAIDLSSNPNSAKMVLEKLLQTKDVFNELSMEEKVLKIIKGGENLKVEFKETLSKNIHTNKKDQNLQISVLKNIVGFLNKNGGKLLVGVTDNGEIKGIEEDFYTNNDKYKLLLSNLINDRIGLKEASFIDVQIHAVKSKKICLINCRKSKNPAYLDGDFYIRTDPECRKLSTKEANEYIREHFK